MAAMAIAAIGEAYNGRTGTVPGTTQIAGGIGMGLPWLVQHGLELLHAPEGGGRTPDEKGYRRILEELDQHLKQVQEALAAPLSPENKPKVIHELMTGIQTDLIRLKLHHARWAALDNEFRDLPSLGRLFDAESRGAVALYAFMIKANTLVQEALLEWNALDSTSERAETFEEERIESKIHDVLLLEHLRSRGIQFVYQAVDQMQRLPDPILQHRYNLYPRILAIFRDAFPYREPASTLEFLDRNLKKEDREAYDRLTTRMAQALRHDLPQGGIVYFDGIAGSGTTTLSAYLRKNMPDQFIAILDLDRFLKNPNSQKAWESVAVKQNTKRFEHAKHVYRQIELEKALQLLTDFMMSAGDPTETFTIEAPTLARDQGMAMEPFTVHRGGYLVVEGEFPHYAKVYPQHSSRPVGIRILIDAVRARNQFMERSMRTYPNEMELLTNRMEYFDLRMIEAWEKYNADTEDHVGFIVDLRGPPSTWSFYIKNQSLPKRWGPGVLRAWIPFIFISAALLGRMPPISGSRTLRVAA
jgi:uridine kinase